MKVARNCSRVLVLLSAAAVCTSCVDASRRDGRPQPQLGALADREESEPAGSVTHNAAGGSPLRFSEPGREPGRGTLRAVATIGVVDGPSEYVFGRVVDAALAPDGSMYVLDMMGPVVRRYDSTGRHLGSFGRLGDGPGEFRRPTMLGVAPDGRVLVGEPRTGAVHVFTSDGAFLDRWNISGEIDRPLITDASGFTYVRLRGGRSEQSRWPTSLGVVDGLPWSIDVVRTSAAEQGILRLGRDGAPDGRIPPVPIPPEPGPYHFDNNGRTYYGIDFLPTVWWAFVPPGRYLTGATNRPEIDILSLSAVGSDQEPSRVATISRRYGPIPISAGERTQIQRQIDAARRNCEGCAWHGPSAAPTEKPAYQRVIVGPDGVIWVMRHTRSEAHRASNEQDAPLIWRETGSTFDVFGPSGAFLGSVAGPPGILPTSVRSGIMLGLTKDLFGVDRVTRLEVSWF